MLSFIISVVITIFLGGIVGVIASKIMKREQRAGIWDDVAVGVGGALLGGLLAKLFDSGDGVSPFITFNVGDILWSLAGAVILCAVVNWLQRRDVR